MGFQNLEEITAETWSKCQKALTLGVANELAAASGDPTPHPKNASLFRLRILPRKKQPKNFWSSTWCFYEIVVGSSSPRDGSGLNVGSVHFIQFVNQKACGGGHYTVPTLEIFKKVQVAHGQFRLNPPGADRVFTAFVRRYPISFRAFPIDEAANDLALMIAETLPKFRQLT